MSRGVSSRATTKPVMTRKLLPHPGPACPWHPLPLPSPPLALGKVPSEAIRGAKAALESSKRPVLDSRGPSLGLLPCTLVCLATSRRVLPPAQNSTQAALRGSLPSLPSILLCSPCESHHRICHLYLLLMTQFLLLHDVLLTWAAQCPHSMPAKPSQPAEGGPLLALGRLCMASLSSEPPSH